MLETTPFSPDILESLHSLIAPGQRVRISPFIESTQFTLLFGKPIPAKNRHDHIRKILKNNSRTIEFLANDFSDFMSQGKKFNPSVYQKKFLMAYLAYYFTTNVCKVQLVLTELVRQKKLNDKFAVLDIGVGAGTTALAVMDFLIAWSNVCDLFGVQMPIQEISFKGIDANQECLTFAGNIVPEFCTQPPFVSS